jgi:hypothetical protein
LFIFQFPATIFWRIGGCIFGKDMNVGEIQKSSTTESTEECTQRGTEIFVLAIPRLEKGKS